MTIADKLTEISDAKQAIVSAVQGKGGTLADKPPIADIAPAIEDLPSGGESGYIGVFTTGSSVDMDVEIIDFLGVSGMTRNYFAYYSGVKEIRGTENLAGVGAYSFYGCSKLQSVEFNKAYSFGGSTFTNCVSLTSAEIPHIVTIPEYGFSRCSSLVTVDFTGATSVGTYAFFNCSSLTHIELPSVKDTSSDAFRNCTSLKSARLPKVESIASPLFSGCDSLEYVFVGTETTTVASLGGTSAFPSSATNLKIVVPDSLVDQYKTTTNWNKIADKIIGLTEWNESQ